MNPADLIQGSQEWLDYRCGKVTSSGIADLMAKSKTTGDWLASRDNYMAKLIAERFTKTPTPEYVNDAMRWGTAKEPEARALYQLMYDVDVQQVGFVDHPQIATSGCSPDGLVPADGLIEIKCPYTATHIKTLRSGKIDGAYHTQMQWQMACTGRQWCHFVSYDPRLEPRMQLFVKRVDRDPNIIAIYEREVMQFIRELDDLMADLDARFPYPDERAVA